MFSNNNFYIIRVWLSLKKKNSKYYKKKISGDHFYFWDLKKKYLQKIMCRICRFFFFFLVDNNKGIEPIMYFFFFNDRFQIWSVGILFGTAQCDKRTVTCDVRTAQCENETIKCEKNVT